MVNRKFAVNKKLWSFNFGCLIACSFLWLIGVANQAPVPELLYPHTTFILDYYPGFVTALLSLLLTLLMVYVMNKAFDICTSDHTFWLALPSLVLLVLTTVSAFELVANMLYAVIPTVATICLFAFFCPMAKQLSNKKCAN